SRAILQQVNHFLDSLLEHKLATLFPFKLRCRAQEDQNRQRELAFAKVGPERLASCSFIPGKIDTIVIDLVSRANLKPEILESLDHTWVRLGDYGSQLRRH